MTDLDLLTEIHTKVTYIAETLEKHVEDDEALKEDYIMPMWNAHQQAKGAAKLGAVMYAVLGGAIIWGLDYLTKGSR